MKTAAANMGLGDARRQRRKTKRRTREVKEKSWRFQRIAFFQRNVRYSASAKATRCALDVTQAELARHFGVSQGTVCNWESGKYAWPGGDDELKQYLRAITQLANR